MSVLDEYYWLEQARPQLLPCAAPPYNRGRGRRHTDGKFGLSDKACHGDHEPVLHSRTRSCTTRPITDFFADEVLDIQLLAVLAHHVRDSRTGTPRRR